MKRIVAFAWIALVLLVPCGTASAQEPPRSPLEDTPTFWGRSTHLREPRTDAGEWDGTYYYVSRQQRMGLWMRTVDGVPEMRIKYVSMWTPEGFETDWQPRAEYEAQNAPGVFELTFDERNADEIRGTWDWVLGSGGRSRTEVGRFVIYRAGDGRNLVLDFETLKRTYHGPDGDRVYDIAPSLTFRKASKRQIRWEELPF